MRSTIHNPHRAAILFAAKTARRQFRNMIATAVARFRNGAEVAAALASGVLATISTHMQRFGADSELCRRYASHAGKKVKAAFETLTGREPLKVWTVRNGHVIEVFAYETGDPAIKCGLSQYNRTAHLVAA